MGTILTIPVWNGRVSTTFDFARTLLVVQTDGGREICRKEVAIGDEPSEKKARMIRDMSVQVVLCGAVSQSLARAVLQAGIEMIPYISGPVDRVLAAYLCGRITDPQFLQPGCRLGARGRWRQRGKVCRGPGNQCFRPAGKGRWTTEPVAEE